MTRYQWGLIAKGLRIGAKLPRARIGRSVDHTRFYASVRVGTARRRNEYTHPKAIDAFCRETPIKVHLALCATRRTMRKLIALGLGAPVRDYLSIAELESLAKGSAR